MKDDKKNIVKNTLIIGIVLTLFLSMLGLSYSFLTGDFIGRDNNSILKVSFKDIRISFTNGNTISSSKIAPGWTSVKTFSVANIGDETITYSIGFDNVTNTLVNKELLTYNLVGTGGGTSLSTATMPSANTGIANVTIEPGQTHSYSMTFLYTEIPGNQGEDMGKQFSFQIKIDEEQNIPMTLANAIIQNNLTNGKTIRTVTSDTMFEDIEPSFVSYNDTGFKSTTTDYSLSSTYTARYFTYGTGYTYDALTDKYTLTGVNYGVYSDIYSTLNSGSTTDMYVESPYGSTTNAVASSSNISSIYKVRAATYDSSVSTGVLTYSTRNEATMNYNTSQSGLWLENRTGKTEDNQPVYFFRGTVQNNYVFFAGKMWRIVRINEDGTIKLILGGNSTTDGYGGTTVYNPNYNAAIYVDYSLSTNALKAANEDWYSNDTKGNLDAYESYIADTKFCNDKSVASTSGNDLYGASLSGNDIYYGAYERLYTNKTPQYKCSNVSDNYIYKIGALTADEVVYAGGMYWGKNSGYYLYDNAQSSDSAGYWWLLSPSYFIGEISPGVFCISGSDFIGYLAFNHDGNIFGFRPVVSLKSDTLMLRGDGSFGNPYVITE